MSKKSTDSTPGVETAAAVPGPATPDRVEAFVAAHHEDAVRICEALRNSAPDGGQAPCLESELSTVLVHWNRALSFDGGARVLHILFGSAIGGDVGCHSFATRMDGTARVIGPDELVAIPQVIAEVRAEAEHARARREGRE